MTKESFATAYERGFRTTICVLTSRGASPEWAEEAAQAAWAKGWEARNQLRDPNRIVPWVNTIAVNHVSSVRRRDRHHGSEDLLADLQQQPTIQTEIEARQLLRLCAKRDRALLADHYLSGLQISAIAERYGLTAVGARVRLHRATRALRRAIAPFGIQGANAIDAVEVRNESLESGFGPGHDRYVLGGVR